jgi:hypothetical protein
MATREILLRTGSVSGVRSKAWNIDQKMEKNKALSIAVHEAWNRFKIF